MNKHVLFFYTVLSSLLMMCIAASPAMFENQKPIGIWEGTLSVGQIKLRVLFKIHSVNDTLKVSFDSPDQGTKDIPANLVEAVNDSILIEVPSIGGKYEGLLSAQSDSLHGNWKQGPYTIPLKMHRIEKVKEVLRPQEPKPPFPYREEEVTFENKKDSVKFAGTLTLPQGEGPFPAAILITGSGAQNRNEELLGHKPFLVLSDYLTRNGIAVLRYDDRGVGGSTGNVSQSTTKSFAGDVLQAVEYLRIRKEIDSKKIGLIGHSEGGVVAPLAASQSSNIAFIVLMAGTGVTGEEIMLPQIESMEQMVNAPAAEIHAKLQMYKKYFDLLKANVDTIVFAEKRRAMASEYISHLSDSTSKTKTVVNVESELNRMNYPWFRFFLSYDPKTALRKVRCPVFAINGEKDRQVLAALNLQNIEKALKKGKNKKYTIKEFKGLNHLFQHSQTGSQMEYGKIEETVAPEVLDAISDWIIKTVK